MQGHAFIPFTWQKSVLIPVLMLNRFPGRKFLEHSGGALSPAGRDVPGKMLSFVTQRAPPEPGQLNEQALSKLSVRLPSANALINFAVARGLRERDWGKTRKEELQLA
jgi:hypothetical protein